MTPRPPAAPVLGAENPTAEYTPTPSDLADLAAYYDLLRQPVGSGPCPWCGQDVLVGDDSDQMGETVFHSRCVRELIEEESR